MQKKVQLPAGEAFTLDSFAQLAKEHYEKAYAMFCSRSFTRTIEKQYPQFEALNRGLRSKTMSMELMEEFLISTGKKSAIKYELKKERQEFSQIASVIQEQIEIVKNGWGYSQIEVFSDAAFLQPEQSLIRPDDFLGSSFTLDYLIDPARMHAGHNFGRIILKSGN